MYCQHCGKEIPDSAQFCPNCGAGLNQDAAPQTQSAPPQEPVAALNREMDPEKWKSLKKWLIRALIAVVVLVALLLGLILGTQKRATSYWNDQLTVNGAEGYGYIPSSVDAVLDVEKMYGDLFDVKDENMEFAKTTSNYRQFRNYFTPSYEGTIANLSNGDSVNCSVYVNYDGINSLPTLKHKLHGDNIISKKYKVKGLEKPQDVDPFENIKGIVYCDDTRGTGVRFFYDTDYEKEIGNMKIVCTGSREYKIVDSEDHVVARYNLDHSSVSGVGDTMRLTLDRAADSLAQYGVVFNKTEKDFTVQPATYLTDAKLLSKEDISELKDLLKGQASNTDKFIACGLVIADDLNDLKGPNRNSVYFVTQDTAGQYCLYEYRDVLLDPEKKASWNSSQPFHLEAIYSTKDGYEEALRNKPADHYTKYDRSDLLK
ncbi:MAG: zinc ribbon domain-containing protein [Clostridia bacterium]|nr:zinc ribbon domain-containing protein [Clostridia bacterium]